jgi:hypothetical protein
LHLIAALPVHIGIVAQRAGKVPFVYTDIFFAIMAKTRKGYTFNENLCFLGCRIFC